MYFITMHIPRVLSPVLIPVDVVRQVSDGNPVTASSENGWLATCCVGEKKTHYAVHVSYVFDNIFNANTILHVLSQTLEPR